MSQINYWKKVEDANFSEFTLVMPSVAVGNVGQLACDLLISSLDMKKVASLHSLAFIPVLGYDAYNLKSEDLSGCCELYQCEKKKILVLQCRSPLIFKYSRQFMDEIIKYFMDQGVSNVVILTSSYAHEKKHIMTSPFRYVADESSPYLNKIKNMNWIEHESHDGSLNIHGGGFASILYKVCKERSLPCIILYKYCSEGDNTLDAYDMIQYLTNVLDIFNDKQDLASQLVQPVSWKFLFGRPAPRDIY